MIFLVEYLILLNFPAHNIWLYALHALNILSFDCGKVFFVWELIPSASNVSSDSPGINYYFNHIAGGQLHCRTEQGIVMRKMFMIEIMMLQR